MRFDIKAVLSTTVLPKDGVYKIRTVSGGNFSEINAPHYIGHPTTKEIVEEMGAYPAESKLFEGLEVGETAVAVSIKQGMSNRVNDGVTNPNQDVTPEMLDFRFIDRIE